MLASVNLSKKELAQPRHIRFIDDCKIVAIGTDLSGRNVLVFEEWNWEDAFRIKSKKYPNNDHRDNIKWPQHLLNPYPYGKLLWTKQISNAMTESKIIDAFRKSHKHAIDQKPDKEKSTSEPIQHDDISKPVDHILNNENLFEVFGVFISGAIIRNIDKNSDFMVVPKGIFLFWKKNEARKGLVWMLSQASSVIKNFSYQYVNNISNDRVLRFDITCSDGNKLYTLLPLDVIIEDRGLPVEWMYGTYYYYIQKKNSSYTTFIHLSTIEQFVSCNAFNGTMAIYDLIQCDNANANDILEKILKHNHYMPTIGPHGENPLIKATEKFKTTSIHQLLDYSLQSCVLKYNPGFMSVVVDALPQLASQYPNILSILIKQCTYIKVPLSWKICLPEISTQNNLPEKEDSTREELWGYKLDGSISFTNSKLYKYFSAMDALFDKWEKIPRHSVTYCYVPLPGLCTYPDSTKSNPSHGILCWLIIFFNILVPRCLSPFAKLAFLRSFEAFQSPSFEAIVKFKWHAFARWRFFGLLITYLIHFGLFVAAISTTAANNDSTEGKQLMFASMVLGVILIFSWIRRAVVHAMHNVGFFKTFTTYIDLIAFALPVITGLLEKGNSSAPPQLQSLSVLSLWIFIIAQFRAFKGIGIFIAVIAYISRKIGWLLLLLAFILVAFAHSFMVLLSGISPDNENNTFMSLDQSLKNIWSMLLSDYSSLTPWTENRLLDIFKIVFSFSTTIVLLNILIALMNNTYEKIYEQAHTAWVMQRAEMIAEIELLWMTPSERQNRNYFPWCIIYEAFTEEVEKWPKKLKEENILMPWVKDDAPTEIEEMIIKVTEKLKESITAELNDLIMAEFRQVISAKAAEGGSQGDAVDVSEK